MKAWKWQGLKGSYLQTEVGIGDGGWARSRRYKELYTRVCVCHLTQSLNYHVHSYVWAQTNAIEAIFSPLSLAGIRSRPSNLRGPVHEKQPSCILPDRRRRLQSNTFSPVMA